MSVYTYIEAQQQFDRLFDEAKASREVLIQNQNGEVFRLELVRKKNLQNTLPHLGVNLSREEILSYLREIRER
jgi:hypothetical protein